MKEQELLNSVKNAIRVLREFSLDEPELGVTELSRRIGISKSSICRILQTLCEEQILQRNPRTRKYCLWLTAFEIGCVVYHKMELRNVALPYLKKMTNTIQGAIQLVIYDKGEIIYLLKLPDSKEFQITNIMGKRVPAHCTASGKVLLAYQSEQEISRVCSRNLSSFSPNTIISEGQLRSEITKIKKLGFAISKEEFRLGMYSVAMPIFDEITGEIVAALSVTGPKRLFSQQQIQHYLAEMKLASRLISENLGLSLEV